MTTYYVGSGGNDGNNGTTWALRKLTLNGAEDIPVVANDTVYVGPGVYRETLTVDVSGAAGQPITYIGDVTGEHTDSVGGVVRITGSDNDQTETRNYAIDDNTTQRNYRTFRGFRFDGCADRCIRAGDAGTNWIIEDCTFNNGASYDIYVNGANQADWTIRRCVFDSSANGLYRIAFIHSGTVDDTGHSVLNCTFSSGNARGISSTRIGGIVVRNCVFATSYCVRVITAISVGQTITVNNCILWGSSGPALQATVLGEIVEDYNTFYANQTDRTNVAVGGNSVAYLPLFDLPVLHAGASQASGYRFPPPIALALSEWSQVRAITGSNEQSIDLLGIGRPATASKNSWGAVQFHDAERDTGTTYDGSTASLVLNDAGRVQFRIPTADATEITISCYVYREANYAGVSPQMLVKQPGQTDDTTTDAAAASQWNLLTTTLTPANSPDYVIVELVSNNTAAAGNYATYFDAITVDSSPAVGDLDNWLTDRLSLSDVQAAGGGGLAGPIFGPSVIIR